MTRGNWKAELRVEEDFLHFEDNIAGTGTATAIVWGTGYVSVGELGLVSVGEGSLAWTIDEPGGILAITTDVNDNENAFLVAGRFQPGNGVAVGNQGGGCWMETRFKFNDVAAAGVAVYAGFTETLAFDTPVMPAEFATATMTYNGTGGMMGALFDADATTLDFRALAGDAAAGAGGSGTTGVRANETMTADEWYIVRVEIGPDGNGMVYVGHKGEALDLIAAANAIQGNSWTAVPITNTDQFYATLGVENRSANAKVLEVDSFYARGWRDLRNN